MEGTGNNLCAHFELVEMQINLTMATEYAEHERLASAKAESCIHWDLTSIRERVERSVLSRESVVFAQYIMLNSAHTDDSPKSEKEMKKLCVIERECAHKIEYIDSRLANVVAEVVNVKLDG